MLGKKQDDNPNVLKWALIRFTISLAAAVIAVGLFAVATKDEAKEGKQEARTAVVTNQELLEAIVKSCEDNGNPLREVLVEELTEKKEQSSNPKLLEQLFPEFPKTSLDELIKVQIKKINERLDKIEPINCQDQYPSTTTEERVP